MNVILIVSDTFRRDHLGCYGNEWIRTRNLDAFAERATVFDRAYTASYATVPHRHDIYTGRYTFTYSAWGPLPKNEMVLPQMLRQAGCVTQLIIDTPHMVRDGFNYDRGFDGWLWIRGQEGERLMTAPRKVELPCDPKKLRYGAARTAQYLREVSLRRFESDYFVAQTMTAAAKWLELNYDQHEKFFLQLDTFDPHEPWDPPRWYVDMYDPGYEGEEVIYPAYLPCDYLTEEELNHCRALYAGEVTMVDRWIGLLLEKVDDLGLLENTAIIFTSDHGFYHGEHGVMGKSIKAHMANGSCPLYEEVAHVPLIAYLPGVGGGERCQALAQAPDLTATILELIDAKSPGTIQGKSLVPLLRGEDVAWRDFAVSSPTIIRGPVSGQRITVTTRDWALICAGQVEAALRDNPGRWMNFERYEKVAGKVENELYDLSKDPKQQNNVFDEERDVTEQLHSKLVEFLEKLGTNEEYLKYWRRL
ncbi:MAG: sulfatase-like hydrolase/transferase [Candidatus Bathyarchaeota archaeon]|nr:sulfatase-like hydrolase/transferase [Candidatus Bathyarchaeota archaeon]